MCVLLCKVDTVIILYCFLFIFNFIFPEEDRYNSYSSMVLKYFMAEGVLCGHELFLASAQDHPDDILTVSITQNQSVKTGPLPVLLCPYVRTLMGNFLFLKSVQPKR